MRSIPFRLAFVLLMMLGYGLYAMLAWGLRVAGGPILPTLPSRPTHAQVQSQRSVHDDLDRFEAIDACLDGQGALLDALDAYDAALVEGDDALARAPSWIPASYGCGSLGAHAGRPTWTEVAAAGRRLDSAARQAVRAATRLQRAATSGTEDAAGAVDAYDVAAREVYAARIALRDAADVHHHDALRRAEELVASDPARAAGIPAMHLMGALYDVDHVLRHDPIDAAGIERAILAVSAARDEVQDPVLRARASELASALHTLKAAASEEAQAAALGAAQQAADALVAPLNAALPAV